MGKVKSSPQGHFWAGPQAPRVLCEGRLQSQKEQARPLPQGRIYALQSQRGRCSPHPQGEGGGALGKPLLVP